MPMMDRFSSFASAEAVPTGAPGTYNVGTALDLGVTTPTDFTQGGQPIYVYVEVDTDFTSGGAATVQVKLVSDSTSSIATSGATQHLATGTMALSTLKKGKVMLCVPLPAIGVPYERWLGVQIIVGTAALVLGNINAYLTHNPPKWTAFADGAADPA